MHYDMIKPCNNCPFKRDGFIPLRAERVEEIASGMLCSQGHTFACHKTTQHDDEDTRVVGSSKHCAGALIFAEKNGTATQMMRIVERLGMYDARKLAPHYDLVFDDLNEMLDAHAQHPFNQRIKKRKHDVDAKLITQLKRRPRKRKARS